jgi:hypothetical protein
VTPEIYIVRVYRRTLKRLGQIAGLVETPGGLRIANFVSVSDLSAILGAPPSICGDARLGKQRRVSNS